MHILDSYFTILRSNSDVTQLGLDHNLSSVIENNQIIALCHCSCFYAICPI